MSQRYTKTTTSHWGAFNVTVENGKIVDVSPFTHDPNPSSISEILPQAVHHRTRVTKPSVRKGWLEGGRNRSRSHRGRDTFVELSWDETLDLAAAELDRVRQEYGNDAIYGGSYGWASAGRFHHALSQVHRFLNCIGGYVGSFGTYSAGTAQAIIPHILGKEFFELTFSSQNSWSMIAQNTKTLVMFGGINQKNSQVSIGGMTRHTTGDWLRKFSSQGMRLVNVSPQRSDTTPDAIWLPVVPGTDTALMLGIAHYLETHNKVDRAFLSRCTVGYDLFRAYLLGQTDNQPKNPEWAEKICGIKVTAICDLADKMVAGRTLITVAWSLQRGEHGEQPFWMATTLAAMLGQIGLAGGGIGYGYGAIGGVGVSVSNLEGLTFPQGINAVKEVIPVARIADMLLHSGERYHFNGEEKSYPDIHLVYWCGGNPFHHHQDLNRLRDAWCNPDTVIVHEPWWTATAKHADIVFPATTPYEREDVGSAQGDAFLFHMPQLIDPIGQARNDFDIFSDLATRLGVGLEFTQDRNVSEWLDHLYSEFLENNKGLGVEIPKLAELRRRNWVELPIWDPPSETVPFSEFREDPTTAPLGTPSGKIEIFSSTIEGFGYNDCPGHPVWREPTEWPNTVLGFEYPLHLISPQPADKLHSQMESAIADIPNQRPSPVTIHPLDAEARSLKEGDIVRIFNSRGACLARTKISSEVRKGVVSLCTGAWFDPGEDGVERQGNPNILTRDKGTSNLGQGSTAHTTMVQIDYYAN
jgi:biotin/methionine sulfoxide reductase